MSYVIRFVGGQYAGHIEGYDGRDATPPGESWETYEGGAAYRTRLAAVIPVPPDPRQAAADLDAAIEAATQSVAGFMSAADKTKLDNAGKGVRVFHNAAQTIPTGTTPTALAFNSERRDDAAFHNPTTNNSRLTVPTGLAGWYHIWANVQWQSNATGFRQIAIRANGTTFIVLDRMDANGTGVTIQVVSTLSYLSDGDYVEALASQTSGGNLSVDAASEYSPEFAMVKVG